MSVQDRVELLKSRIIHYTKDLLEFETVEIRLLDRATQKLEPLLTVGMVPEAADSRTVRPPAGERRDRVRGGDRQELSLRRHDERSPVSDRRRRRPQLADGPAVLHDQILGTFNVESTRPGAFNENDLQFLELFSREVAVALNTLELLVAEKMTTATESTEMILREVANPVDEVLNDTAWILERYIGHDPNVCPAAAAGPQAHARHPLADPQSRRIDRSRRWRIRRSRRGRSARSCAANACWWPTTTKLVRRAAHELLGRLRLRSRDGPQRRRSAAHGPQSSSTTSSWPTSAFPT